MHIKLSCAIQRPCHVHFPKLRCCNATATLLGKPSWCCFSGHCANGEWSRANEVIGWCMVEGLWCFMASYIFEDIYFTSGHEDVYYIYMYFYKYILYVYIYICCPFQKCRVLRLHNCAGVKPRWSWGVSRFSRASIGTNAFSRHFAGHFQQPSRHSHDVNGYKGYNNGNASFVHVEPFMGEGESHDFL